MIKLHRQKCNEVYVDLEIFGFSNRRGKNSQLASCYITISTRLAKTNFRRKKNLYKLQEIAYNPELLLVKIASLLELLLLLRFTNSKCKLTLQEQIRDFVYLRVKRLHKSTLKLPVLIRH